MYLIFYIYLMKDSLISAFYSTLSLPNNSLSTPLVNGLPKAKALGCFLLGTCYLLQCLRISRCLKF